MSTRDERPATGGGADYRGRELGLPAAGPGSVAGFPVRILALLVDWAVANAVAFAIAGPAAWSAGSQLFWLPLTVWFLLVTAATGLTGASAGQWLLRLRVIRLDRQPVGLPRAAARTALIALVLPPIILAADGRGLHDLALGTVVVHGPR